MRDERKAALGHWPVYLFCRGTLALLQALPWRLARRVARLLGGLAYLLDVSGRKRLALANIRRAFPDISDREARRILRGVYCHFAAAVVDTANVCRFAGREQRDELFETVGFEKLRAMPRRTGVIFVTGHVGHWEVLGVASSLLGYPVWSIARRLKNPLIGRFLTRVREAMGQRTMVKEDAWRQIIRLLQRGESVAALIDQDVRSKGIFVDFFGRPASTAPSVARLAIRTGAPVAFVCARRVGSQNRFRIAVTDLITPQPERSRDQEVRRITQRLTQDLEDVVRQAPEQWLWLHRRWKTRPGDYEPARKAVVCADTWPDGAPGRPSLDEAVVRLRDAGLREVCLVVPPGAEARREEAARVQARTGVRVECVARPERSGPAGAVLAAEDFIGRSSFIFADAAWSYPADVLAALVDMRGRRCWIAAADRDYVEREGGLPAGHTRNLPVLVVSRTGQVHRILKRRPWLGSRWRGRQLWAPLGLYRLRSEVFEDYRALGSNSHGAGPTLAAAIGLLLPKGQVRLQAILKRLG